MPASNSVDTYDYAYIRIVPRVEREEFINAGVILYCRSRRFLAAAIRLDGERLRLLYPQLDLAAVGEQLALIVRICQGEGPVGKLGQAEAFHWLVAPHSTVIQSSSVHCGLCQNPQVALEHLVETM